MLLPPANEVCEGYVFTGVCLSTGGRAWLLLGGVHGYSLGGHAWLLLGGMRGCSQGGHVWLLPGECVVAPGGACVVAMGGMHGCSQGGCVWLLQGGMHGCSGGHVWLLPGEHAWLLGGCAWLLPEVCMVAPGGHVRDTMRYGDMVNERAVRILLECILVCFNMNARHKYLGIFAFQQIQEYEVCLFLNPVYVFANLN